MAVAKPNVTERVRRIYLRRPYPAIDEAARKLRPIWRIAPMPWIEAMWQPAQAAPRRILVAGCGTGNEAFALRTLFPKAEIVGVDFCARSIRIARQLQAHLSRRKTVRFITADLTNRQFAKSVGEKFDFISCHGVLSYIPEVKTALRNLASALSDDGALYLGVNGVSHFSENWRPLLAEFGIRPDEFRDGQHVRDILKLFQVIAGLEIEVATQPPEYLASDLFGPFIANHPLHHWIAQALRAGLHFAGSYSAHRLLRRAFNAQQHELLLPRSRPDAHKVAEQLAPSGFHYLLFTRKPATLSHWPEDDDLLECGVVRTKLYALPVAKLQRRARALQPLVLTSAATNTRVDLRVPPWVCKLLRGAKESRSVAELLGPKARQISPSSLGRELYLLYLLGAINLTRG